MGKELAYHPYWAREHALPAGPPFFLSQFPEITSCVFPRRGGKGGEARVWHACVCSRRQGPPPAVVCTWAFKPGRFLECPLGSECCAVTVGTPTGCALHTPHCPAERGRQGCRQRRSTWDGKGFKGSPRWEPALGEENCKGQSGTLMPGEVAGTVCDAWRRSPTARRSSVKLGGSVQGEEAD